MAARNDKTTHPDIRSPEGISVERLAADLWRQENPTQSVFACDHETQEQYRSRARQMLTAV